MNDGVVRSEIADMRGRSALPRDNGELVFAAPWEGRVLALAIAVVQSLGLQWDEFRLRLIEEIAGDPERTYYESWLSALERLVVEQGTVAVQELAGLRSRMGDLLSASEDVELT
jgi:nitrile hydratase accessory protein